MDRNPSIFAWSVLVAMVTVHTCIAEVSVENKTDQPVMVKVRGVIARQIFINPQRSKDLELKTGLYYTKLQYGVTNGARYALGPFLFTSRKSKVAITLPSSNDARWITKAQFDDDSNDADLLNKAYATPESELRWAKIVLDLVDASQMESSLILFSGLSDVLGEEMSMQLRGFNLQATSSGGPRPTITDIAKKYGKASTHRDTTDRVSTGTKNESVAYDVYGYNGIIELECRKGQESIERINAPGLWLALGIRNFAQVAVDPSFPTKARPKKTFPGGAISSSDFNDLLWWHQEFPSATNNLRLKNPTGRMANVSLRSNGYGKNVDLKPNESLSVAVPSGLFDVLYYFNNNDPNTATVWFYLSDFFIKDSSRSIETLLDPAEELGIQKLLKNSLMGMASPPVRIPESKATGIIQTENLAQTDNAEAKIEKPVAKTRSAEAALKFNQTSAAKGEAYGLMRMGERYRDGDGVEKDLTKAKDYLSKAAAAGSPTAAEALKKLQ